MSNKNKARILIVEDDMPLALLMADVLTRAGCDVETACTGKKAMAIAAERTFDLITLDVKLPDKSGFDICSELKQRHVSRNTPVIFISASPCEEDIAEGMKRGAVDYITKPFAATDFFYRVIYHAKARTRQIAGALTEERGT